MKKVLTIAGSDSGGGAGIQADLRTMTVLGVFGMTALTALTAQNTRGVSAIYPVSPEFLDQQLEAVLGDLGADAVKTGMLFSADLIDVVADKIRRFKVVNLVVDPVMISKSGHRLLEEKALDRLVGELFPLSRVVTPNLPEAEMIVGRKILDLEGMVECARLIGALGPESVVITGGHLENNSSDVLYDGAIEVIEGIRLTGGPIHGTGCTFSAALASFLALGHPLKQAVREAKSFITASIAAARPLGKGYPPANQLFSLEGGAE